MEFSDTERDRVTILRNKIYRHKVMRVNYTTYDMRRDQDSINPRTHPFVMTLSPNTTPGSHPYWYARVVGIFHLDVLYKPASDTPPALHRVDILWVRWLDYDTSRPGGFEHRRLHRVRFVSTHSGSSPAFGFLDPGTVIRGAHLLPVFHSGRTKELLAPSIARLQKEENEDWAYLYVGM